MEVLEEVDVYKPTPRTKLEFLKSPVIGSTEGIDRLQEEASGRSGYKHGPEHSVPGVASSKLECVGHEGLPVFRKFADASYLEIFTDLFFAANYSVFTQTQKVTNVNSLATYVGYFAILWITWLMVTLYDVRFVTDSVFERLCRGVHLGVTVGFAVVAPKFDPKNQDVKTMKTMSVILALSRFCLSLEYLSVFWHARRFKRARAVIVAQTWFYAVSGLIYLGITFRFRGGNSDVYKAWYVLGAVEVAFTIGTAIRFDILSVTQTHLMKRMGLLTAIILGDGVVVTAQDVVVIVQAPDAWTPLIIGTVTSSCIASYTVFLVYFDWIREDYLPKLRQTLWVCIHFPLHLALVLFMTGFTQLIMWTKAWTAMESLNIDSEFLRDITKMSKASSDDVSEAAGAAMDKFFKDWKPSSSSLVTASDAIYNISIVPDKWWHQHPDAIANLFDAGDFFEVKTDDDVTVSNAIVGLIFSMVNTVLETFGLKITEDVAQEAEKTKSGLDTNGLEFQIRASTEAQKRLEVVFTYGFISGGVALILMVVLAAISRKEAWTPWPVIRHVLNVLIGIGMACVSLVYRNDWNGETFIESGVALPLFALMWTLVLLLTHIGNAAPTVRRLIGRWQTTMPGRDTELHFFEQQESNRTDPLSHEREQQSMTGWHGQFGYKDISASHHPFDLQSRSDTWQTSFRAQIGDDGTTYGQRNYNL